MEKHLQNNQLMNRLFYIISFILLVALYGQVIWNNFDYVWDDEVIFIKNQSLVYDPLSFKLLATPILEGTSYFRPTVLFSWWLEFHTFGRVSEISHAINILVFYGSILFLFNIIKIILENKKYGVFSASLASLIFLCHPMHVEAVVWVSGRFDVFTAFFLLFSSYLMLKMQSSNLKSIILILLYILALGSKELAIFFIPFIFIIWELKNHSNGTNFKKTILNFYFENKKFLIASLLITVLYLIIRVYFASGLTHFNEKGVQSQIIYYQHLVPLISFKEYLVRTITPFFDLGIYSSIGYFIQSGNKIKSVVFCFIFILMALYFLIKKNKTIFVLFGYFMLLSLVVYIIPITIEGNIVQDRFLHSPLIFYAILLSFMISFIFEKISSLKTTILNVKTVVFLLFFYNLLLILFASILVPNWRNDLFFFQAMSHYQEKYSGIHHDSYLTYLIKYRTKDEELNKKREKEIERLIKRDIEYAAQNKNFNMKDRLLSHARFYMEKKDKKAVEIYENFFNLLEENKINFRHRNDYMVAYINYAISLFMINNDLEKASLVLDKGKKYLPTYVDYNFYFFSTILNLMLNDFDKAQNSFQTLLKYGGLDVHHEIKKINKEIKENCTSKPRDIIACSEEFDSGTILLKK